MGEEPTERSRSPRLAISADHIFDGYRWHDDAVILIDRGIVQGIARQEQGVNDWPTEVMPPGTRLAPGFIDLQVNGGGGILLNDQPTPDAMRAIARTHRRYGTTSCLPTLISDTREKAISQSRRQDHWTAGMGYWVFISKAPSLVHRAREFIWATVSDPLRATISTGLANCRHSDRPW